MIPRPVLRAPSLLRALRRCERGTTAVEFGLIALLLFIVSFGIIDFGLAYWQWIMAEKATQVGVRTAVVSNIVPKGAGGLNTWPINQTLTSATASANGTACMDSSGNILTDCTFSPVTCTSDSGGTTITCTCPNNKNCPSGSAAATDFTFIVAEMQKMDPYIGNNNVQITYGPNGLGFVGRPNGLPYTVTVTLTGMKFRFLLVGTLVGGPNNFSMPPFKATLIGEDLCTSNACS